MPAAVSCPESCLPGCVRRQHMISSHWRVHVLWKKVWFVSFFFYFPCCSSFLLLFPGFTPGLQSWLLFTGILQRLKKFCFYFSLEGKWDKYLTNCTKTFFSQSRFSTTLPANFIPRSAHLARLRAHSPPLTYTASRCAHFRPQRSGGSHLEPMWDSGLRAGSYLSFLVMQEPWPHFPEFWRPFWTGHRRHFHALECQPLFLVK